MMKMALHGSIEVGRAPFGMEMNDADSRNVWRAPSERVEQHGGRGRGPLHEDLMARFDEGECRVGADELHQMSHLSTRSFAALAPSVARSSSVTGNGP